MPKFTNFRLRLFGPVIQTIEELIDLVGEIADLNDEIKVLKESKKQRLLQVRREFDANITDATKRRLEKVAVARDWATAQDNKHLFSGAQTFDCLHGHIGYRMNEGRREFFVIARRRDTTPTQ